MPDIETQGILQNILLAPEQVTVLAPYLRRVFIPEAPLTSLLPRRPVANTTYNIVTYDVRPRKYTLGGAIVTGDAIITLSDASGLMMGDVLELIKTDGTAKERVEITADPILGSTNTAAIRRGREGTTAVANDHSANLTVTLIGNSRTGAEIDQTGTRQIRTLIPQNVQSFQYPVQIGGLANAVQATAIPEGGGKDIFTFEQRTKMTEMMRDIEYTSYYGLGETVAAAGDRGKQKGVRALIGYYNGGATMAAGSNTNVKTGAGGSYTFLNFVADGIQKAIDGGGNPDLVVCSTSFLTGLQTWGFAKQQINTAGAKGIGLPINVIEVPFGSGVIKFLPSYQLAAGTAMALTSADICMRYIREESWRARANRGDAIEGEFFGDLCVELGHPGWHSWVEGISSYA